MVTVLSSFGDSINNNDGLRIRHMEGESYGVSHFRDDVHRRVAELLQPILTKEEISRLEPTIDTIIDADIRENGLESHATKSYMDTFVHRITSFIFASNDEKSDPTDQEVTS